jgi:predicted nucleotidyltransferase
MPPRTDEALLERVRRIAPRPGLGALLLFGSRATGEVHEGSDWDFAVLRDPGAPGEALDLEALRADLVEAVASERVDIVDLERATALLRFRAARDGIVLGARDPDAVPRFQIEAASFWCDVEPVLRRAYDEVLAEFVRA